MELRDNLGRYKKGTTPFMKGRKGIHLSIDTEFKKGQTCFWKGKKFSEEYKKKLSEAHKGYKPSEETRKKMGDAHRGEKSNNWRGGVTPKDILERKRFRNNIQRIIFERDDYTCQICGSRGIDLQVDHIQPWAEYVELRFNIENCRTLCAKCHYQITFGRPMPESIRGWGHNLLKGVFVE